MTRTEFIDLLDAYWNAAYHEGEAAATTDTPDGRAGKINSALMREYDALAARLAEAEALLREGADNAEDFIGTDRGFPLADWLAKCRAFLTADSAAADRESDAP